MRWLFAIIALLFVSACSGSGSSNYSAVMSAVDNSGGGKVFVLRDTGFSGSGALMNVTLNGSGIGRIGNGETTVGTASNGTNYIEVSFGGFAGMGINSAPASFQGSNDKNSYFIAKLTAGALQNRLQLFEVSEAAFKGSF